MFKPPVMFTATGMIVGVLVLGANSSLAQGNVENNIDRPGADYKNFNLPRPDYRICKQACEDDGQCQAWTYVKPGIQGRSARCWLKVKVPRARASNCCISGQKTGRGFSWHFANLNKINPRGGFSRHQYPDGTYDVWQNGGARHSRTKTKRLPEGLETLYWNWDVEGMPGQLTVGQPAQIRLKGNVKGYKRPAGKSAEVVRGTIFCVRGCQIVHKGTNRRMVGFELSDRTRHFDLALEIVPPNARPTGPRVFPIEIEMSTRGTKAVWSYLPN